MSVVFNSFEVIEIDGIPAGNIVDVISNHAPRRAEVLAAFGVYVAKLQTEINAEKVELQADKAKLTSDLSAKTTAYDAEVEKVTALEAEKATLTTEKTQLTADLATANATIAELQAKITALEAIRQFNPRWTTPDFFQNRFTAKEGRMFERSDDPMLAGGRDLLDYYEENNFHVDLDDPQVQGLTAHMVTLEILTPERREQVLRDVTAAEAWYPE